MGKTGDKRGATVSITREQLAAVESAQARLLADRINDMIDSVPVYVEYVKVCESRKHGVARFADWYACSPPATQNEAVQP